MSHLKRHIFIWQRIISPHMAGLAVALVRQGHVVTYVAERAMSTERARQGWQAPSLAEALLLLAPTAIAAVNIVDSAPLDSVHICQGIRSNGVVSVAQSALARRGLQQWVVMETLDDHGFFALLKRITYRLLFWRARKQIVGVLAIGWRTADWVVARRMDSRRVFPFAYFLSDITDAALLQCKRQECFRFLFVGQLIERKRVGLLIDALAAVDQLPFELIVIGDGPCKSKWRARAEEALPGRVRWLGQLPMVQVSSNMHEADCLVLPSRNDGWGAVVSEALMVGTQVICSDACGSAGVVRVSQVGGVFTSDHLDSLTAQLKKILQRGVLPPKECEKLAKWAKALGAEAGARYLSEILAYLEGRGERPQVPWQSYISFSR